MPNNSVSQKAVRRGHETSDASAKGIGIFILFFVLGLVLIVVGVYFFFAADLKTKPVPHPALAAEEANIAPHQPLVLFNEKEQSKLNSYGWVDRKHGVTRIPIERAMELLVQRGLPVRSESSTNEKSRLQLQQERANEK
jgi:hypothetical protein